MKEWAGNIKSEVISNAYTQLLQEGGCMQEGKEAGAEWDKNSNVPAGLEASVVISGLTCPSPDWLAHQTQQLIPKETETSSEHSGCIMKLHDPVQSWKPQSLIKQLSYRWLHVRIHPLHLSMTRSSPCIDNEKFWEDLKVRLPPLYTDFPVMWEKDNGLMPGIPERKTAFQFSFYKQSCFTQ